MGETLFIDAFRRTSILASVRMIWRGVLKLFLCLIQDPLLLERPRGCFFKGGHSFTFWFI
jgi:hypothetical protein